MTNAHVVAGVDDPEVEIGGDTVSAEVVHYNPDVDIAVLALDTSGLPAARPSTTRPVRATESRSSATRRTGRTTCRPGRIRAEQRLRSPDIYGEGSVMREVFSLRGLVRPGNSGGPIVSSGGDVVGVVFAASVTDQDTGYALTAAQVAQNAASGRGRLHPGRHRRLRGLTGSSVRLRTGP